MAMVYGPNALKEGWRGALAALVWGAAQKLLLASEGLREDVRMPFTGKPPPSVAAFSVNGYNQLDDSVYYWCASGFGRAGRQGGRCLLYTSRCV